MILIDTSVWVEYLRATGSKTDKHLTKLIKAGDELATTEPVVMEVLAGARDDQHTDELRRVLYRGTLIHASGLQTFGHASAIYRECRQAGETVASLVDCHIAAVCIENDAKVLAVDRDYEMIAKHTTLETL